VPELPEKFTPEMVIPEIAKQLNAAINPDEPTTSLVYNEDYLDFYASAFNYVNKYPELKKLLEEALLSETKLRKAFLFNRVEDLSASSFWTMNDAWLVLNNPALAEKLVLKLEKHPDPLKEKEPYTKENIIEPISDDSAEYDTVTCLPHVLAAAALTISNSDIYFINIEQQVGSFLKKYKLSNYKNYGLEYIVKVGQALKLLANNFTKTSFSDSIEQILQTLKDEVYIRFRDNYKNLNLHQKIQTAHFLSDVWRSYLNTPDFMVVKIPEKFAPEQMIVGPDGDNITGKVLDNERYRYSVALEHAINYLKISGKTIPAKYNWMDNFLKDWYSYLFNVHKGGFLQAHESKLEEYKIRTYKEIGVYDYYIRKKSSDDKE